MKINNIDKGLSFERFLFFKYITREEYEILVNTAKGKIGNMKATDFLKACISSGVMVKAVSTEEQVKQANKETAEKILRKGKEFYNSKKDKKLAFNLFAMWIESQFGVEIKE